MRAEARQSYDKNLPSLESASSSCLVRLDSALLWFLETTPLTRVLLRPLVRLTMACMFLPFLACGLHLYFSPEPGASQSNLHIEPECSLCQYANRNWLSLDQVLGQQRPVCFWKHVHVSLSTKLFYRNINREILNNEHLQFRSNWGISSKSCRHIGCSANTNSPSGPHSVPLLSLPRKVIISSNSRNTSLQSALHCTGQ